MDAILLFKSVPVQPQVVLNRRGTRLFRADMKDASHNREATLKAAVGQRVAHRGFLAKDFPWVETLVENPLVLFVDQLFQFPTEVFTVVRVMAPVHRPGLELCPEAAAEIQLHCLFKPFIANDVQVIRNASIEHIVVLEINPPGRPASASFCARPLSQGCTLRR